MGLAGVRARIDAIRARSPWFDHAVRTVVRYRNDDGDRLAASLTYYGFLSLFPVLLVALSALGYALAGAPSRAERVFEAITDALPGVGAQIAASLGAVQDHRASTGLLGLAGLVLAGLGGVDALRASLRILWHQDKAAGNLVRRRLSDALVLGGLAVVLLLSLGVSALGAGAIGWLLDTMDITGPLAAAVLQVISLVVALAADTLLFLWLFTRLAQCSLPWRSVLRGAVLGAVGFGVLKYAGAFYVSHTATRSTALYGTVGVVIAILVGLNLAARWVLLAAVWTATGGEAAAALEGCETPEQRTGATDDSRSGRDRLHRARDRVGAAP